MREGFVASILLALTACGGGSAECGEAECADVCASAEASTPQPSSAVAPGSTGGGTLTAFEKDLVAPLLDDIRGGVRPYDETGVGICEGTKSCETFMGVNPGELPPGKYMVRAEVRVPKTGDKGTWKVNFETECTTTRKTDSGETTSTSNYNRTYEVRYAGEDRGYRLQPLRTIESPNKGGSRVCTYKIIAPHPDGDQVYEGGWAIPEAG